MSELTPGDKRLHKALNKAMKNDKGFFDTILEAAQAKRIEQLQTELTKTTTLYGKEVEHNTKLQNLLAAYKETYKDKQRLCKEIDDIITDSHPAKQASLCDLVGPIRNLKAELETIKNKNAKIHRTL